MNYYTTAEICKMFNNCTRDYISKLARLRKWRFQTYQVRNTIAKRYSVEDVKAELERREAKKLEQIN